MSDDLKACPFCGGEALFSRPKDGWRLHKVSCKNCDASPASELSKAEAIAAWNTRAPAIAPVDLRERVARAIRYAINPLDGDPIGVMIHNYEYLDADGIPAQIALVDEVCMVMADAAILALTTHSAEVGL